MTQIEQLEQQLAAAKQANQPHVTEIIESSREQVVTKNHTTGTVRKDLLGGHVQEEPQVTVKEPEIHLLDRAVDPGVKLVSNDDVNRVVELGSGTVGTDLR